MNSFAYPIQTAAWQFPVVAAVLTLPYMLYCYRKYGAVSIYRSLVLFSMIFYLQCAFYLVILPLPDPETVADNQGPFYQLIPFQNVLDFLAKSSFRISDPGTWIGALKEPYVLEPLFNITLTVPFGIYLAYYFKTSLRKVIVVSFLLSLFFELTQLSGLYWIYPKPYRLFDVNDLILNTLGGVIGYFIYVKLLRFLPGKERIDQRSAQRSVVVGYTRRMFALVADGVIVLLIDQLITFLTHSEAEFTYHIVFFVYFLAVAVVFRGRTPGKSLVRIKIGRADAGTEGLSLRVLFRYLLRSALLWVFLVVTGTVDILPTPHPQWFIIAQLLLILLVLIDFLLSFRRNRRLWYEVASGTQNVSTFAVDADGRGKASTGRDEKKEADRNNAERKGRPEKD
jgi:glycopeptide antibiotics resistance protein